MDVVFEHADRILVLNRGTLIAEGSPEEVRRNPQVRAIYLGEGLVYDARHREGAGAMKLIGRGAQQLLRPGSHPVRHRA